MNAYMTVRMPSSIGSWLLVSTVVIGLFVLFIQSITVELLIFSTIDDDISLNERLAAGEHVRAFHKDGTALPPALFTEREQIHMADVKRIFDALRLVFVLLFLSLPIWLPQLQTSAALRQLVRASGVTALILLAAAVLLALVFTPLFQLMHRVLFVNDYWMLDPALHLLIRVYPPSFFWLFALCFVVTAAALLLGVRSILNTYRYRPSLRQ